MAEALGTASSIIALVDVTEKAIRYLKAVKNASKECEDVAQELCLLSVYATRLKGLLNSPRGDVNNAWTSSLRQLDAPNGPLPRLIFLLTKLSYKVRPPKGRLGLLKRHALWIVEKEEVQELLTCIARSMALLKAAIELDHLKLSLAIKEDLETVRAGVDVIRSDVNTIRTQNEFFLTIMLKAIRTNNDFERIGQASRDRSFETRVQVCRWLVGYLDPHAAFVKKVASHDVWKRISTQYRKGSAYILPKSYKDYLENYPEITNRFEIVKLTDDGSNLDSVLYRHMSYILDCILWADGISIAWKALYDISIRSADLGPNLDLLALLLTQESLNANPGVSVDFKARVKYDFEPPVDSTRLRMVTGQTVRISSILSNGTFWGGVDNREGSVMPCLVEILDISERDRVILNASPSYPSDFFARLTSTCEGPNMDFDTSEYHPRCPGEIVHLFPYPGGRISAWGEYSGRWKWFWPGECRRLESWYNVNLRVRVKEACYFPQCPCGCNALAYSLGDQITVTKKYSDGWWWGELNGREGWIWSRDVKEEEDVYPDSKLKLSEVEPNSS